VDAAGGTGIKSDWLQAYAWVLPPFEDGMTVNITLYQHGWEITLDGYVKNFVI
jgi:hypothetical protein